MNKGPIWAKQFFEYSSQEVPVDLNFIYPLNFYYPYVSKIIKTSFGIAFLNIHLGHLLRQGAV